MNKDNFELKETYLSKGRHSYALEVSLFTVLVIIFFSNIQWENFFGIKINLEATSNEVFLNNKYWKAWTTTLIHGDITHLLSNISMLILWGFLSSTYYGPIFYPLVPFFMNGLLTLFCSQILPFKYCSFRFFSPVFLLGGTGFLSIF